MTIILAHGPSLFQLAALLLTIFLMLVFPPRLMLPGGVPSRRRRVLGILAGILLNIIGIVLLVFAEAFTPSLPTFSAADIPSWEEAADAENLGLICVLLVLELLICRAQWQLNKSGHQLPPVPPKS